MANIAAFKSSFKGDIVLPEDADFAKAIARWSVTAERNAAIVAFVKDAEDIGLAIKFAKENKLPIAIRGGGHNPAGASSSENGIVIDLSRYINTVRIDAEKKLGYVGGGAIWETVDKEAIKHGLATVGGTVNHTGVGGLILGGGFGWLSASYGLAIDNLVQVTIVPASGVAVTANESTNPDLFWAVKGGGSNFGVVTEFVLKLHPQRATVYAGPLVFIPPQTPKLNEVTTEWYKNAGEKEAMIQIVTVGPDGNPVIIAVVFYNGTEAEGKAAFKAFYDIGPVADHTGEVPYETVNSLQNKQAYHGQGVYFKGVSPRLPAEKNMVKAHQRAIEITNSPQFGGIRPTLLFEYFPMTKINSVADDATAFHRNVSPSVLMFIAWPGETNKELTDGKTKVELARQIGNELGDILSEGHDEFSLGYTNYDVDGEASQSQAQKAFASNYPKLQKVKKEWDPEVIFNKWFPITPA